MKLVYVFIFLAIIYSCKKEIPVPKQITQYSIDQFFKTENINGGSFNKDETKILVNSNRSQIFNVFELDLRDTSMVSKTNSTQESYFSVGYLHGTDHLLYTADKGGDENDHIFLQRTDGSVKDLTPGQKEKAAYYGKSRDKKSIYYISNVRKPQFFDLYRMDTATWTPTLIYKNDNGMDVGSISNNERFFLINKNITTDKNEMYLYDALSKKTKKISTDSPEDATYSPGEFELNDSAFYYITNEGNDFSYIVKYNLADDKKEKFYDTQWDVNYMSISENGKYHIISTNEDARAKVSLFDHVTGKELEMPKLPSGYISGVTISPSEKRMLLTVVSDRSSANKFLYDIGTKELKQLTNTLTPEINSNDLVDATIVRFKSFDGLDIPAVFYKPKNASALNKLPALVSVHGGPGGQSTPGYNNQTQYLVNQGYAILAVNNRGSSGYGKAFYKMDNQNHGDKDLKDCVWGKKWLAQQDYIDSNKIGIMGGSYGGFMSLAGIIQYPKEFAVSIDIFGVTNWLRTLQSIPPYWESFRKALYDEMGDPGSADSARLKNISPLYNTDKIKTPLLVLQGSNDPRVLQVESDEIVAGAKKNGTPVEYVLFPDEGHGFVKKENQKKACVEMVRFLDKYLKKDKSMLN